MPRQLTGSRIRGRAFGLFSRRDFGKIAVSQVPRQAAPMSRSPEVDAWFERYDNPCKAVVQRVRELVLQADPRIGECIKWQAPTFTYCGNMASFFPKSRQHASLLFHQGAQIPGVHPLLQDDGGQARTLKLATVAEADAARADIERIVRAWCDARAAQDGRRTP